jgi:hypothetical protein
LAFKTPFEAGFAPGWLGFFCCEEIACFALGDSDLGAHSVEQSITFNAHFAHE